MRAKHHEAHAARIREVMERKGVRPGSFWDRVASAHDRVAREMHEGTFACGFCGRVIRGRRCRCRRRLID